MGFCSWPCCLFHLFFAEIDRLQIFKNILDIELSLVTAWSAFIFSVENLGFPLDFPADIFWGQWLRVKAVGGLLWSDAASLIGPAAHSSTQHRTTAHSSTQHNRATHLTLECAPGTKVTSRSIKPHSALHRTLHTMVDQHIVHSAHWTSVQHG